MATDEFDEEATAIENMLDRIQPQYPSLSREELRRLFHETYDRMASEKFNIQ